MKPETAIAKLDQATKMLAEVRSAEDAKQVASMAEAAEVYARKMGLGVDAITYAVSVRIDATRLLGGYLLKSPRHKVGRPKKNGSAKDQLPTLAELGIDKKVSHKAQKLAKMPDREFARFRDDLIKAATGLRIPSRSGPDLDDSDECYTPEEWIDRVRQVMDGIDVDPFSCDLAQRTVGAATFYTAEDNGLDQEWNGRVWYQPPYSAPLVADAAAKLLVEIDAGRTTAAIGLTNTCTSSAWWQLLAQRAAVVMFPRYRINFFRPAGGGEITLQKGNRADQTFFYFGTDPHRFEYVFGEHGVFGRLRGNSPG